MLTNRMRIEIPSGAQLPVAHLPRHQSLRQAGQVILSLLLTGLAAAAVWVLLVVLAVVSGGVGPQCPRPPAPPSPQAHPPPRPPGTWPEPRTASAAPR